MNETQSYLIEFFESACPNYEDYTGKDPYEAIQKFKDYHPYAQIQNVCLILNLKEEIYASND
jgi:hypothetical protein